MHHVLCMLLTVKLLYLDSMLESLLDAAFVVELCPPHHLGLACWGGDRTMVTVVPFIFGADTAAASP
jgi:hypothetical protein